MKKKMLLGLILVIYGGAHAESLVIPEEYKFGSQDHEDGFYILDASKSTSGQDVVVFMFASLKKERPKINEIWRTHCFNSINKGLREFKCTLEQKDFYIGLTSNEKIAVFNKKNLSSKNLYEVNYKVDSNAIISEKYQLLTPYKTELLLKQLINANNLSYSWKNSQGYISQDIKMDGFKPSYAFAKRMLEVNN